MKYKIAVSASQLANCVFLHAYSRTVVDSPVKNRRTE